MTSSAAAFGEAGTAKYVSLTTYRKDGTAVTSPLWAALDGDRLVMWTVADSWKVKRLRRDPRVVVQACDVRGHKTFGEPVSGTAEVLDEAGSDSVKRAIARKYGLLGKITILGSKIRRGKHGSVGIVITPAA
ncbi:MULTISPECIES: PPOX class F420-dependent oxidoreductase [Gordonia]|jgi:PPOX class probable F420-dependent enzyme|uniref:PPOX class F420-dependent oxidoreductase n=2 Tax=Gordonia terrae TaxID=2055 RepID=A0AAD0K9E2_9ACTN|nr:MULTISPECIES: PPOX class F420-dependent oxidoreductase [Gordonia]VTR07812.1 PPOX class probable F420-dependent enzyme, Rv2061 family [Clostridioides difficile]ANY24978.1 PPOX class F420-dependent enzyme [Gordonia terrae]AWO85728.1 PPOX class F420-dependent oxidoreductase [Gordonia terrae]MCG7635246.1 PPOX class F420-dependent oxidoreductase [Gordonia sp. McavH-238-E]VTS61128.1 PPOX class probable F420-dependent enzyme, Rv2061 family [Gordonia terrae]